ncbi:MAG: hypothetical protein ACLFWL_18335 [Candidatus Brocadiia bacterium]
MPLCGCWSFVLRGPQASAPRSELQPPAEVQSARWSGPSSARDVVIRFASTTVFEPYSDRVINISGGDSHLAGAPAPALECGSQFGNAERSTAFLLLFSGAGGNPERDAAIRGSRRGPQAGEPVLQGFLNFLSVFSTVPTQVHFRPPVAVYTHCQELHREET